MPSVLSKPLNLWDKTTTQVEDGAMVYDFSPSPALNQGNDGDYHWWVETADKRIVDNTPLCSGTTGNLAELETKVINKLCGVDYDRPFYYEWTDPELVAKMDSTRISHLAAFVQDNNIPPDHLPFAMDALYKVAAFQALSCDLNASATQRNLPGSRLCVGTFGHRCGGKNKGTICVAFGK